MGKRTQRKRSTGRSDILFFLCLAVLAVFFLAGVILGLVLAHRNPDAVDLELSRYLTDYFRLSPEETSSGHVFLSALLIYFRYPLLALLFGFTAAGVILLPLTAAVCGFFLSYSVSCFAAVFSSAGVLVALAAFGLRCVVTLPCFFLLAVPALQRAVTALVWRLSGRGRRIAPQRSGTGQWLETGVIAAILLAGALAEVIVSPALLKLVLEKFLL